MATMDVMRGPGMERLSRGAKEAANHPWAKKLGRMGYAAKGAVYAIIGVLALKLAAGEGGRTTDSHGAVNTVARGPFGIVLLSVLVVGLLGYVVWRFAQAFADTEDKGSDAKGLATRAMYFFSGALYASLALFALKTVLGASQGRSKGTQGWTATLMEQPFGRVLVALVGLGIIGFAVKQFHTAWKAKFLEKLTLTGLAAQQRHWVERVSRFGIAARGVVFSVIGIFLVRSAVDANPGEAKGLAEALAVVARQPAGDVLLGVVAAGLVAYAAYLFLQARYREL